MTEQAGRCGVAVKINALDQQVSRDDQITIGHLTDDRSIVADSVDQASGMLSRSRLFTKAPNEVEFVHER